MPISFRYIDVHSHLNLPQFDADRDAAIARCKSEGVAAITVGVDFESSRAAVALAEIHEHLFASVGLHPTDAPHEPFDPSAYMKLAERSKKVVAVGECGLDYFRTKGDEDRKRQREIFILQIELAQALSLPLMIHCRPTKGTDDAYENAHEILGPHPGVHANFHFYVGGMEITKKLLAEGHTFSFSGIITFTHELDQVIRMLPDAAILPETDAPFAAPAPYRGKRCEPWHVKEVYRKIAEIREENKETMRQKLMENVSRIFQIEKPVSFEGLGQL